MANLEPIVDQVSEVQPSEAQSTKSEDVLEVLDLGPCTEEDRYLNTRGASLNYVIHQIQASGVFCADRSSLKGDE